MLLFEWKYGLHSVWRIGGGCVCCQPVSGSQGTPLSTLMYDPQRNPEYFYRIRIRIWILSVLWQCKVVYTRKKYFKNRGFTHFQVIFSIFSDKNNHRSHTRRNICLMWKIFRCLNWFLVSASRIRIWFLKFWFAGSRSGRKWAGSAIQPWWQGSDIGQ